MIIRHPDVLATYIKLHFIRVSHTKTALVGTSLSVPITSGSLNLGTWQGELFLLNFRLGSLCFIHRVFQEYISPNLDMSPIRDAL